MLLIWILYLLYCCCLLQVRCSPLFTHIGSDGTPHPLLIACRVSHLIHPTNKAYSFVAKYSLVLLSPVDQRIQSYQVTPNKQGVQKQMNGELETFYGN
jgi:hypothetical protein